MYPTYPGINVLYITWSGKSIHNLRDVFKLEFVKANCCGSLLCDCFSEILSALGFRARILFICSIQCRSTQNSISIHTYIYTYFHEMYPEMTQIHITKLIVLISIPSKVRLPFN